MANIDSNNPKLKMVGNPAGQVTPQKGMNVGGLPDAQVRNNFWAQGRMLMQQLRKNKSGSSPL